MELKIYGIYQHWKGQRYAILNFAKDSETQEDVVVYLALYKPYQIWVRPLKMFKEEVEVNGQKVPRFQLISD